MNAEREGEVLGWFERALDVPAENRLAWLEDKALPPWLHARVLRLLDAQARAEDNGFLDQPAMQPEPEDFPRIGEKVGPFRLVRRIDAGGMGVVYLARRDDGSFEQEVALKLIRPLHLAVHAGFRAQWIERFENERRLLARLQHPNVARILDGGATASGIPWLAMEYVDGVALIEHCERGSLDMRARLRLFIRVCAGVQEAHRHLIVHRDLKPDNILVGADGEPKLLDFGIARLLDDDVEDAAGITRFTAMTPAYASPEHVRRQPLTTASDVYSLGVLLYQLLAGIRPYQLDGLSPGEVERTICGAEPAALRTALRDADDPRRAAHVALVTPDLERVVAKAMHKDPARRYDTAQALADDISRWLGGKPVLAHPDSAGYRIGKFVRRHPLGVAATGAALAMMLAASGIALWQARQARQAAIDLRGMNAFLLEVLQTSDPFDADRELTLSEALDSAAASIDERFAQRPALSAELRFGIGYSMLSRYRLEQADRQLGLALAESRAAFGDDDIRTLRVRDGIAYLRQEQNRGDEAETGFRELAAGLERLHLTDDPLYGNVLGNLGNLYLIREDYRQAGSWLQRCKAWYDAHPDAPDHERANLLSNLAHLAHGRENLDEAERLYAQAQQAMEALYPHGNPDLAILLNNRALLTEEREDPVAALQLHRQSLAMRQKVFSSEHPMTLTALTHVARLSVIVGDARQALALAEQAAAMSDRVYADAPSDRHASTWATLAAARLANDDDSAAATALQRADALLATVEHPAPSVAAYLQKVRAQLAARRGGVDTPAPG